MTEEGNSTDEKRTLLAGASEEDLGVQRSVVYVVNVGVCRCAVQRVKTLNSIVNLPGS